MPQHIVILTHRRDHFDAFTYLLRDMAAVWRDQGHRVTVLRGPDRRATGDLAILHIDLTKVARDYLPSPGKYARVLNGAVLDISKRCISTHRVRHARDYDGPVMVKADRNCGGTPEMQLARRGPFWQKWSSRLRRKLDWTLQSHLQEYRVFDSPREVPAPVWWNPHLVVERFLPERRGRYYCLRSWLFMGDRESNTLWHSLDPQVKSSNIIGHEDVAEVPEEMRERRRELGFDYGKFDYGIVDGRAILYDANRTPTAGAVPPDVLAPRIAALAAGLQAYL